MCAGRLSHVPDNQEEQLKPVYLPQNVKEKVVCRAQTTTMENFEILRSVGK